MMLVATYGHVCWAQPQSPIRIQKAPAPAVTNRISTEELSRLAVEQNRMLEKQNPWLAIAKTNKIFAQAMNYILADMAGHKPEKLPQGLTQTDISNAYVQMFIAPQSNHVSGVQSAKRPAARLQQSESENAPPKQPNWMLEPLPPGRNLQERLEEFARQKGVPLNVLTQQAATQISNVFSQELNRSIEFYGKAVDENGVPLEGVRATISCLIFPEKQFVTNVVTDSNGFFALRGVSGQALMLALAKESYEEVPGTNQNQFVYYGVVNGFQPDSNNPVVFRLRKKAILR